MTRFEKLLRILADSDWRKALLRYYVGASAEHRLALSGLSCAHVVDIGANRGQFSLLARRLFPSAKIIAFEPLAQAAQVYRRVFADDANVTLHECALGERAGDAEIHISGSDDSSSLLPITDLQASTFPGTGEVGTASVTVAPLADVLKAADIRRPLLMKLDVQGFELNALKGAEPLMGCFDYVYCECSFVEMYGGQALADEVVDWLHKRGFVMQGVYNVAYDQQGKAVQADFLFKR